MNKSRRYTSEEDEAIFRTVKDSDVSLKSCFIALSKQLNRSERGIAQRWYAHLSNPESPFYKGTAMILIKENRAARNRTTMKFPVDTRKSIWRRLLIFLRLDK